MVSKDTGGSSLGRQSLQARSEVRASSVHSSKRESLHSSKALIVCPALGLFVDSLHLLLRCDAVRQGLVMSRVTTPARGREDAGTDLCFRWVRSCIQRSSYSRWAGGIWT